MEIFPLAGDTNILVMEVVEVFPAKEALGDILECLRKPYDHSVSQDMLYVLGAVRFVYCIEILRGCLKYDVC
jgi:hypothetical protein